MSFHVISSHESSQKKKLGQALRVYPTSASANVACKALCASIRKSFCTHVSIHDKNNRQSRRAASESFTVQLGPL
jgi:hypothetical protein